MLAESAESIKDGTKVLNRKTDRMARQTVSSFIQFFYFVRFFGITPELDF